VVAASAEAFVKAVAEVTLSGGISRLRGAPEPAHRLGRPARHAIAVAVAEGKVELGLRVPEPRCRAKVPHGARYVPPDTDTVVVQGAQIEICTCVALRGRALPALGGASNVTTPQISRERKAVAEGSVPGWWKMQGDLRFLGILATR
jgi:hypothetical protein